MASRPIRKLDDIQDENRRMTAQIRDLKARVSLAEKSLSTSQASELRFRNIFDHSNDAIFLVDPMDDEILDVNRRACEMLGYSREELIAIPMSMIHPHEMARMRKFARSVFNTGKGWTNKLTCLTKNRVVLDSEISASITELDGRKCMIAMVRDVTERNRLVQEKDLLQEEIRARSSSIIIGQSPAMLTIMEQVRMVAPTDSTVLITGESGTGKEVIARAIHEKSRRREHPMVRVNCAAIPDELFESEFFGHVKGAFTGAVKDRTGRFELAHNGTLFMDEIGDIPPALQSKLLRVLQEQTLERVGETRTRRINVRVVAATNRDLREQIRTGTFREDLFYRLSVFPIRIPPLRERREDILPLAQFHLEQACRQFSTQIPELTPDHIRQLESYSWPGNVRELQNVIQRAVITTQDGIFKLHLDDPSPESSGIPDPGTMTLTNLKDLEKQIIQQALAQSGGRIYGPNGAAAILDIKPTTLASRMKKMGK